MIPVDRAICAYKPSAFARFMYYIFCQSLMVIIDQEKPILPITGKLGDGDECRYICLATEVAGVERPINGQFLLSFKFNTDNQLDQFLLSFKFNTDNQLDQCKKLIQWALDSLVTNLLDTLASFNQRNDSLEQENGCLEERIVSLEQEIASLQSQNSDLQTQSCGLQLQTSDLETHNRKLMQDVSNLVARLASGKAAYDILSRKVTELAHENVGLHTRIGELLQQIEKINNASSIKEKQQIIAGITNQDKITLMAKVNNQATEMEFLRGELETSKQEKNALLLVEANLTKEINKMLEKDLQQKYHSLVENKSERRIAVCTDMQLSAEQRVVAQRGETTREQQVADYRERQELISKVAFITNERDFLKKQCQQLENNNEYLASTIVTVMTECLNLTQELASSYDEKANLNELYASLLEKITTLLKSSPRKPQKAAPRKPQKAAPRKPQKAAPRKPQKATPRKPLKSSPRNTPKAVFILVEEHNAILQQYEEKINRCEAEKYRLQEELLRVNSYVVELTGRETSLKGTISLLESKLISSQEALTSQAARFEKQHEETVNFYDETIVTFENENQELAEVKAFLETKVSKYTEAITSFKSTVASIIQENNQLVKKNNQLVKDNRLLAEVNSRLVKEKHLLAEQSKLFGEAMVSAIKGRNSLLSEIESLKEENARLAKDLDVRVDFYNDRIYKLDCKLDSCLAHNANLVSKLKSCQERLTSCEAKLSKMENALKKAKNTAITYEMKFLNLHREVNGKGCYALYDEVRGHRNTRNPAEFSVETGAGQGLAFTETPSSDASPREASSRDDSPHSDSYKDLVVFYNQPSDELVVTDAEEIVADFIAEEEYKGENTTSDDSYNTELGRKLAIITTNARLELTRPVFTSQANPERVPSGQATIIRVTTNRDTKAHDITSVLWSRRKARTGQPTKKHVPEICLRGKLLNKATKSTVQPTEKSSQKISISIPSK